MTTSDLDLSVKAVTKANRESEKALAGVYRPVGVFIGGTSGVGLHAAYAFAKHTADPRLYIIGRDSQAGMNVLNKLLAIQPEGHYEFIQCDMAQHEEVDDMTSRILNHESKVNVLSVSCGTAGITTTKQTQQLYLYSRWRAIDALLPLVGKAADRSEPATVVSVLAPFGMKKIGDTDLELKEGATFPVMGIWAGRLTNLLCAKYASFYPKVNFMNVFPGLVSTGLYRELPAGLRTPARWMMKLALENPEQCGERMHYLNYVANLSPGVHLVGYGGNDLVNKYTGLGYLDNGSQDTAYEFVKSKF